MFFVKYGTYLKESDPQRLTEEEWTIVMDVVDMLGPFKPHTTSMEVEGQGAIVHVLPQLLRLTCRVLTKPAATAHKYSGRTTSFLATKFKVPETDTSAMVSDI